MKKYFLLWFVFAASFYNNTFAQIADTISISTNNFCAGTSVIIRATHQPNDTNPTFQFFVNNVSKQNNNVDSFIYASYNNNDSVKCFYRSHNLHSANDSVMSNTIYLVVKKKSTKSINDYVCAGKQYLFNGNYYHSTGSYTVHFTNYVGCDSAVTLHLQVHQLPPAAITPDLDSVCLGDSITLVASGGLNYSWLPSGYGGSSYVVHPTANSTYKLVGINPDGCTDTTSATINVTTVHPHAKFGFTDSANVYYFTDSSTHALSYNWQFGDGGSSTAKNPTYVYPTIGIFVMQLIVTNLCGNDTSATVYINVSTGIEQLSNSHSQLIIYPNPAKDELRITIDELRLNTIEINDVLGRKCISIVNPKSKIVNVANLSSGIYFIKATDAAGNSYTTKFVKE